MESTIKRVITAGEWKVRGEDRYDVTTFLLSLEVQDIISRIETDQWKIPNLQRGGDVWKIAQKRKFIDSIIKGYPIPGIMIVNGKEKYILDGFQRLSTIKSFIEDGFKTEKSKQTDSGLKYSGLPSEIRNKIMTTVIGIQQVQAKNPVGDTSFMYEIFARINSGGTSLTGQEIRNALNDSDEMNEIRKFATDEVEKNNGKNILLKLKKTKLKKTKSSDVNKVIEGIFRINYFINMGDKLKKTNSFRHINNKNTITLNDALDKFTRYYFESSDFALTNKSSLIENYKYFVYEINNFNLFSWIKSYDSSMGRTTSTQPTFLDSASIFLGKHNKLKHFDDQLKLLKQLKDDKDVYANYKILFQQNTLSLKHIISRFKFLFDE